MVKSKESNKTIRYGLKLLLYSEKTGCILVYLPYCVVFMSKIIVFTFLCFFLLNTSAQERVSIKLQVIECKTKESLPFANIISQKRKTKTASNFDGLFTFKTAEDDTLKV